MVIIPNCNVLIFFVYAFIEMQIECSNPSLLPEPGKRKSIEEPYVKVIFLF